MYEYQMIQIANRPFIQYKAYKLLHRLCKEAKVPRSKRAQVRILISNKQYNYKPVLTWTIGFNAIAVDIKWLNENLTKKEFAQFVKLRISI